MNEKVKLPKFMCDWLKGFEKNYPLNVITKVNLLRKSEYNEVSYWLSADVDNQWKLIDALRYGYEAEPEQLYYVLLVKGDDESFLNVFRGNGRTQVDNRSEDNYWETKLTMPKIEAIDPRYKAFAVPVEEVEADD